MIEIDLDREELVYSGRIDRRNRKRPEFIFPASSLEFRFFGRKAVLVLENRNVYWNNYVGAIVDGVQKCWILKKEGQTEISFLEEEQDGVHSVLFFKRQDSCHEIRLCSLLVSDGGRMLEAPEKPKRKIEVYGDSVSAGEVSEAVDWFGRADPRVTYFWFQRTGQGTPGHLRILEAEEMAEELAAYLESLEIEGW